MNNPDQEIKNLEEDKRPLPAQPKLLADLKKKITT